MAWLPLPAHAQALAVAHAGRNFHLVILHDRNVPVAAATPAHLPALETGAVAIGADDIAPHADGADGPAHRLFQSHHDDALHVLAFFRLRLACRAAPAAEKLLEEIAE